MVKDQTINAENSKQGVLAKLKYDQQYKDRLNTRKKENEVLHKNTLQYKSEMHAKQQEFEQTLAQNQKKRKPFDAKINEKSLANATAYRQKQKQAYGNPDETLDFGLNDNMHVEYMDNTAASGIDMLNDEPAGADSIQAKLL